MTQATGTATATSTPAEPVSSSPVGLRLRLYIDNPSARKMWKAQTSVTLAVKRAFDEAGIKIPYPQRELSGSEETGGFRVAGGEGELTAPADTASKTEANGGTSDESNQEGYR